MKAFNPFNNLAHMTRELRVILPKPKEEWRMVNPSPIGDVHGLPGLRGIIVASNGILDLLLTPTGAVSFIHHEWFNEDADVVPHPFRPVPGQHRPKYMDEYV